MKKLIQSIALLFVICWVAFLPSNAHAYMGYCGAPGHHHPNHEIHTGEDIVGELQPWVSYNAKEVEYRFLGYVYCGMH